MPTRSELECRPRPIPDGVGGLDLLDGRGVAPKKGVPRTRHTTVWSMAIVWNWPKSSAVSASPASPTNEIVRGARPKRVPRLACVMPECSLHCGPTQFAQRTSRQSRCDLKTFWILNLENAACLLIEASSRELGHSERLRRKPLTLSPLFTDGTCTRSAAGCTVMTKKPSKHNLRTAATFTFLLINRRTSSRNFTSQRQYYLLSSPIARANGSRYEHVAGKYLQLHVNTSWCRRMFCTQLLMLIL